jgi:hypothetical protein
MISPCGRRRLQCSDCAVSAAKIRKVPASFNSKYDLPTAQLSVIFIHVDTRPPDTPPRQQNLDISHLPHLLQEPLSSSTRSSKMSAPNRQPRQVSLDALLYVFRTNIVQPGHAVMPRGYFVEEGNPVPVPNAQAQPAPGGDVRITSHGTLGYPEVPEDAFNDDRPEMATQRSLPTFRPGPLPAEYVDQFQTPGRPATEDGGQNQDADQSLPPGTDQGSPSRRGSASTEVASGPASDLGQSPFRSGRRGSDAFVGYPGENAAIPADLSCYQACQQYPGSLFDHKLDAFLQRNWSAGEMYACLPQQVQDIRNTSNPTWITNRMVKRQDMLIAAGRWDTEIYGAAAAGNFLREDGRPADMVRRKSHFACPTAAEIRPNGV